MWVPLMKLSTKDDIEANIEAFDWAVEVAQWPKEQEAYIRGPYLSGEGQATLKALERAESTNYTKEKGAILDRLMVTP